MAFRPNGRNTGPSSRGGRSGGRSSGRRGGRSGRPYPGGIGSASDSDASRYSAGASSSSGNSQPRDNLGPRGQTSGSSIGGRHQNPLPMPCRLYCNHFTVRFQPPPEAEGKRIYRYKVTYGGGNNGQNIELRLKKKILHRLRLMADYGLLHPNNRSCAYHGVDEIYTMQPLIEPATDVERTQLIDLRADRQNQPEAGDHAFSVTIKFEEEINPETLWNGELVLDNVRAGPVLTALRHFLNALSANRDRMVISVGQNYYSRDLYPIHIDRGSLEVWKGFHSSFRLSYDNANSERASLMLNFNDAMTTVLPSNQSIEQFIFKRFGHIDLRDERRREEVSAALKGVRVQTTHLANRTYVISELSSESSRTITFDWRDPQARVPPARDLLRSDPPGTRRSTVEAYFNAKYSHSLAHSRLSHPDWPLLLMKGNGGQVYIPLELCTIKEGQRSKKLDAKQKREFLTHVKNPSEKKTQIEKLLGDAKYGDQDGGLSKIGVQIGTMIRVEGRVLHAPEVMFRGGVSSNNRDRKWNFLGNYNDKRVPDTPSRRAAPGDKLCAVYVFADSYKYDRDLGNKLATDLSAIMRRMGIPHHFDESEVMLERERIEPGPYHPDERIRHMLTAIRESGRKQLVLAVLPNKSSELYGPLKGICEHDDEIGLITQCVTKPLSGRNIHEGYQEPYLANVALKINLKMGGTNWTVNIGELLRPSERGDHLRTCIFGLDVSHGSPEDDGKPSIAAVVASVEKHNWSRYAPRVWAQAAGDEIIANLEEMAIELLGEYKNNHEGYAPEQIIIYRDGVSESQFEAVTRTELMALERACAMVNTQHGDKIKIVLIIVQKRHHTRFFAGEVNNNQNQNSIRNMDPGTVVDRGVIQTKGKDFYLCSHECLIKNATSRPAHYTVLQNDDEKLTLSEIQKLTHALCYCFGRATRAVSIPAPVYCAHVAAKHYSNFNPMLDRVPHGEDHRSRKIELHRNLKGHNHSSMFYI